MRLAASYDSAGQSLLCLPPEAERRLSRRNLLSRQSAAAANGKGAGALGRQVMGFVVIGGMLAASAIAIFLMPATFYVSERLFSGRKAVPPQEKAERSLDSAIPRVGAITVASSVFGETPVSILNSGHTLCGNLTPIVSSCSSDELGYCDLVDVDWRMRRHGCAESFVWNRAASRGSFVFRSVRVRSDLKLRLDDR